MHKKLKIDGHNAHVLHDELGRDTGLLYTVNPEKCRVTVWIRVHTLSPEGIPDSYKALQTLSIRRRMLGQHGYLQSVIRKLRKPVEVWREEAITYLTGMNYMSPAERIDKAFKLISKEEKKMDTSNIKHFVLVAKIKSDDDRVMHDWEYMQVVQQGNRFMLLFDNADITHAEAIDLTKYLSGVLSIEDVGLSTNPEFMNYSISFTDNSGLGADRLKHLCSILADGAKYKHTYPLRARHKATSSISSIVFSIQENGDTPIFTKRWDEGLNGYVSIKARVYDENGVDVRPYKPLDSDILRFYVRNGRVWLLRYPTTVLETMGAIPETWSKCPQILTTEYRDEDHLIMDCRAVLEHFGMYRNASTVKLCWYPTVNGI